MLQFCLAGLNAGATVWQLQTYQPTWCMMSPDIQTCTLGASVAQTKDINLSTVNHNLQLCKRLQVWAALYLTDVMCRCHPSQCRPLITRKVAIPEDLLCSWSVGSSSGSSCLNLAAPLASFRARGPEQKPLWPANLVQQGLRPHRPGAPVHHPSHFCHGMAIPVRALSLGKSMV